MGLLTLPFRLPFLPLQGVINLAGIIEEEADRQLHDPAAIRRQLEAIAAARAAGRISPEEAAEAERAVTMRLVRPEYAIGGLEERGT